MCVEFSWPQYIVPVKADFFALLTGVKGVFTIALPPPPDAVLASEEYIPTQSVPAIQDVATPLNVVLVAERE